MSTAAATSSHTAAGEPAPWRGLFAEHVAAMQSPEFTLGTIRRVPASSGFGLDDGKGSRITPRARTCVFRGLWASLPVNPKNNAELNPDWYESEMPTFTTDVRMDKIPELWEEEAQLPGGAAAEAEGGAHDTSAYTGSGGGGPVEAVFVSVLSNPRRPDKPRQLFISPRPSRARPSDGFLISLPRRVTVLKQTHPRRPPPPINPIPIPVK